MCAKKKRDGGRSALSDEKDKTVKVFHAMRNGHLYRSTDGVNWELETDPDILIIPEGTSRITPPD